MTNKEGFFCGLRVGHGSHADRRQGTPVAFSLSSLSDGFVSPASAKLRKMTGPENKTY
ncbi:MAG: hypothetical protein ACETV0_03285 [Nitrososphaeria archaeon]